MLAESFAAGEAPLHTSLIADQIFDEMAAEGELSNVALSRLLVLYGQKTLEAALGLLVNARAATFPCVLASFPHKLKQDIFPAGQGQGSKAGRYEWQVVLRRRGLCGRALRSVLSLQRVFSLMQYQLQRDATTERVWSFTCSHLTSQCGEQCAFRITVRVITSSALC